MERIERLISIVMILLQKNRVSATEFSQLFQVSKRTVLRDMETLGLSNIPIYATYGVHGGYGIMDEYKLDKRLVSSKDLENILTALGGMGQILFSDEVALTLKKIEAMLGTAFNQSSMQLSFYEWEGRAEILQILKQCQDSIIERRVISFDYIDKNGTATKRRVEPYRLQYRETSWYMRGFCLQRQQYRTFKLSRMDQLQMENIRYNPREDELEQEHAASGQPPILAIKALISPGIKDRLIERYGRKSIEAYNDEYCLATLHVPHSPIGFQFLAGFGTELVIVEPAGFAEEFRNYLMDMLAGYS